MQPPPVPNGLPHIADLVCADLDAFGYVEAAAAVRERKQIGIEKYGTALQPFNGRRAGRDLVDELTDAPQYAKQWLREIAHANPDDPDLDAIGSIYWRLLQLLSEAEQIRLRREGRAVDAAVRP